MNTIINGDVVRKVQQCGVSDNGIELMGVKLTGITKLISFYSWVE